MIANRINRIISSIVILMFAMTIVAAFDLETFAASTPGTVKITSAEATSPSSITLKWKKVSGASGYKVYKVTKSGTKTITTLKGTSKRTYTIKNLKSPGKYSYKVRAYKKSGKKTYYGKYSKKVSVKLTGAVVVSTNTELNKALKDKSVSQITISTNQKIEMEIPEGDYSSVDLIVETPNADIVNRGSFKTITINQIASDTWTEIAKGNVLIINAVAGHVVIPEDAGIKEIRIVGSSSSFILDVEGSIDKIVVDSKAKLTVNVEGSVGSIEVNDRSTININGSSTEAIDVIVSEKADATSVTSNVKIEVYTSANTEINLSAGAEGSTIKTENKEKSVEVTNNTTQAVSVIISGGESQSVEAGKNATIDGEGNVTGSTDEEGGPEGGDGGSSGGGGGSQPSGDITRVISYFETIPYIFAGTEGESLKTIEQINTELPTTVKAFDNKGNSFNISVKEWRNEEGYTINSSAGSYKYAAVLGDSSVTYTNPDSKKATVFVVVSHKTEIEFGDVDFLEVQKYEQLPQYTDEEDGLCTYYAITNKSKQNSVNISGTVKFYDPQGYLVETNRLSPASWNNNNRYKLAPEETKLFYAGTYISQNGYTAYLDLSDSTENNGYIKDDVLEQVTIETTEETDGISYKLTNTSDQQIGPVTIATLFLDENGFAIGMRNAQSSKIYGAGYTDTVEVRYPRIWIEDPDDEDGGYSVMLVPDSYLTFVTGAEVVQQEPAMTEDSIPDFLEVQKYEQLPQYTDEEDGLCAYYAITNKSKQNSVNISGTVKFYDPQGYLVETNRLSPASWNNNNRYKLAPEETKLFYAGTYISQNGYTAYLDLSDSTENNGYIKDDVLEQVTIETTEETDGISYKLTNTSDQQIGPVTIATLFLDENGFAIGMRNAQSSKIYGAGYTDTVEVRYPRIWIEDPDDEDGGYSVMLVPDSYLTFVTGAEVVQQ